MKLTRVLLVLNYFRLIVPATLLFSSLLPSSIEAAGIKNVQRGSVTFAAGANRMAVVLPQPIDPTKTIVWGGIAHGGGRSSGANPNDTRIAFDLEAGTTLALERVGSPATSPVVEWQAVEFATGVSVQRGLRSMTTAETTVNVTIPTAVDLSKSFVVVSVAPNTTSQTTDERWTIRSRLTTATNLEISRTESGIAVDIYWQVVQMDGATVQRGLSTIASGASSATATITAVDATRSFLIMSSRGAAAVNGIESQYVARGTVTNGTTLTFNRVSTTNTVDIAWQLVAMNDGTTVQRGSRTTTATTDAILDQAITAVDPSRSFVFLSVQGGSGTATANLDEVSWTGTLTTSTNLRLQRAGTGTQGTVNWQVIQLVLPTPTKLAITLVNGGSSPTAGAGFPVVVQSQDSTGTPRNVQSATAVSLSLKTGTGTLGGTLTGTIAAGTNQITISAATYAKAESGIVLTASVTSGGALTPGDSAAFTVNPGPATTLAFTTQPGSAAAGNPIAGPPTVAVRDNFGNTVTSSIASITIGIGTNPSGGILSGTTNRNAAGGIASLTDLSIDRAGHGYTLTASSTGLTGATSAAFVVNPPPATKLVIISVNGGSNPTAGIGFSAVVQARDSAGNAANVNSATAVRLNLKTGTGTLGGTLTGTIAANANQVTISGITYAKAETGVVLTASRTSGDVLTAGDSASFMVNPGAATKLTYTVLPGNGTAGSIIPGPPTVTVQDSLGNTVTASTAPITVTIGTNPGGGVLGGIATKNAVSGVARFLDLRIDKPGTGYTLTATSTGLTGATSAAFAVSPGAAAKLVFITQPLNSNVGSSIAGPPTIAVQDNFGNTVTNSSAAITVSIGNNPSAGSLIGTKTSSVSSGAASFPGLSIKQPGNGYTLTVSSTGLTGVTSSAFNVTTVSATRNLTVSKIGSGTITSSTGGINCGSNCSASLNEGTVVTLKATAAAGWNFSHWTGNFDCADGSVTLHTDQTCTANFTTTAPGFVQITSPAPNSVINSYSALVQGSLSVPTGIEVGVTVNGVVAATHGGVFAAMVPIAPGTTNLTAVATTVIGTTASHSVPVSVSLAQGPSIALNATPQNGVTPMVPLYTIRSDFVLAQVELDVDSDGTVDFTAGADFNGASFILSQPAVYVATARVTDSLGNVFTSNTVVQVHDRDQLDARLQAKWAAMKDALRNGDIGSAVNFISVRERAVYENILTALGAQTGNIDQILTDISFVEQQNARSEYRMLRADGGVNVSHFILFAIDEDGIWRLKFF